MTNALPALGRFWRKISLKKYIFTILILLIFFTNAFCQVSDKDTDLSKKINMPIDEVKKNIISFYSEEISGRKFLNIIPISTFVESNCFIVNWETQISLSDETAIEITYFVINNNVIEDYGLLGHTESSEYLNKYEEQNFLLFSQLKNFRIENKFGFIYDFNHDGKMKLLNFEESGNGNYYTIIYFDPLLKKSRIILSIYVNYFSWHIQNIEFINYKCRQGIKFYTGEKFVFYYYDRIQQKYLQDETASSEELERIHGSPDFFAEAGIDYTKLERLLLPADLEGFSKAALRIWRNAVYARHGRIFKSEDLQALFNEYAWYTPDENYSDDKLTDIDRANIELIQEFEEK